MSIRPPFYVFDKELFIERLAEYQRNATVYYPLKANDDPIIAQLVLERGGEFEVDSIEHIKYLIDELSIPPDKLLYSFPVREEEDIDTALGLGLRKFVVDGLSEFRKISNRTQSARYLVRINSNLFLNDTLKPWQNKWGASIKNAKLLIRDIAEVPSRFMGISYYVSTAVETQNAHDIILKRLCTEFADFRIPCVDIGGGIALEELGSLGDLLAEVKRTLGADEIIVEPGRHLLDPCVDMCVTVTEIRYIGDKRLVFINAGIYSGLGDARMKGKRFSIDDPNIGGREEKAMVCGSSSDVDDYLDVHDLRSTLKVGDRLFIRDCGAYSAVMQTNFCGKSPMAMIVRSDYYALQGE